MHGQQNIKFTAHVSYRNVSCSSVSLEANCRAGCVLQLLRCLQIWTS